MAEKLCTRCGRLNAARARFCSVCGAQDFVEAPAEQLPGASPSQGAVAGTAVRINMTRIVVLSAVTFSGLYFFYWLYLTWKQLQGETQEVHYPAWYTHIPTLLIPTYGLFGPAWYTLIFTLFGLIYVLFRLPEHVRTWKHLQSETREVHYPVWHALTMFVPVYGLFRLHKHLGVVQALARRADVNTSLTPGLAVVLIALTWVLGLVSMGAAGPELLVLSLVSFALTTTTMVWAQGTLNAYWYKVRGASLQDAPVGIWEKALVLLGILLWLNVFISVL